MARLPNVVANTVFIPSSWKARRVLDEQRRPSLMPRGYTNPTALYKLRHSKGMGLAESTVMDVYEPGTQSFVSQSFFCFFCLVSADMQNPEAVLESARHATVQTRHAGRSRSTDDRQWGRILTD